VAFLYRRYHAPLLLLLRLLLLHHHHHLLLLLLPLLLLPLVPPLHGGDPRRVRATGPDVVAVGASHVENGRGCGAKCPLRRGGRGGSASGQALLVKDRGIRECYAMCAAEEEQEE